MKLIARRTHEFIEIKVDSIETTIFKSSPKEIQDTIDNLMSVVEDLQSYQPLKVAEAKQLPTNNVTEGELEELADEWRKENGFNNRGDNWLSYIEGIRKGLSISSPEKQEAKQLHEVKDECNHSFYTPNVLHALPRCRWCGGVVSEGITWDEYYKHYLLPSEQTPDGWVVGNTFYNTLPTNENSLTVTPVYFSPQQNNVSDEVTIKESRIPP